MMDDKLIFQNYLVVFFDQLGQRDVLRRITALPTNDEEKKDFIDVMKDSVGRVIRIRKAFKDYFDSVSSHTPNTDLVLPNFRQEFLNTQKFDIRFYGLSDAVIVAVPLMSSNENCTAVNGIFSAFVVTCAIGLGLLADKKGSSRAGLDVGVATQIEDNEIYGPALERAYFLESELAEYPRFLVGDELRKYLEWVANRDCSTRPGEIAKEMAEKCRRMICQDSDGRFMLDFLGKEIKEMPGNVIDLEMINSASEFVQSQYEKYSENNNSKLASRYLRLLQYINSRKSIWGND